MLIDANRLENLKIRMKTFRNQLKIVDEITEKDYIKTIAATANQKSNFQLEIQTADHYVLSDEPELSGGDNTAPSPVTLLISAFAGCMEMNWLLLSSIYKLPVHEVKVGIQAKLDQRYKLGGKEAPPARLHSVVITTYIKTTEKIMDKDKFERMLEKAIKACPVGGSLHPDIKKTYKLEFKTP